MNSGSVTSGPACPSERSFDDALRVVLPGGPSPDRVAGRDQGVSKGHEAGPSMDWRPRLASRTPSPVRRRRLGLHPGRRPPRLAAASRARAPRALSKARRRRAARRRPSGDRHLHRARSHPVVELLGDLEVGCRVGDDRGGRRSVPVVASLYGCEEAEEFLGDAFWLAAVVRGHVPHTIDLHALDVRQHCSQRIECDLQRVRAPAAAE
jgi:hypothetical protein